MSRRTSHLRRLYGMAPATYDAMLASQDGRCALCRWQPTKHDRVLVVDHDHATGQVRGLLCHDCNLFLGRVEKYLDRSPEEVRGVWVGDVWYQLFPSHSYDPKFSGGFYTAGYYLHPTGVVWRDGRPKRVRP